MVDPAEIGRTIAHHQEARAAHERAASMHRYEARLAELAGDAATALRQLVLAESHDAAAAAEHGRAIEASRSSGPDRGGPRAT